MCHFPGAPHVLPPQDGPGVSGAASDLPRKQPGPLRARLIVRQDGNRVS